MEKYLEPEGSWGEKILRVQLKEGPYWILYLETSLNGRADPIRPNGTNSASITYKRMKVLQGIDLK